MSIFHQSIADFIGLVCFFYQSGCHDRSKHQIEPKMVGYTLEIKKEGKWWFPSGRRTTHRRRGISSFLVAND